MIDTHVHLNLIKAPLDCVLKRASDAGVHHIIQVAIDISSIEANVSHYMMFDMCSVTGGIHPLSVNDDLEIESVIMLLKQHMDDFVAIGEIGLDYKYGQENKVKQHLFFKAQLDLAMQYDKPVIIHSRHCDDDMLAIVNDYPMIKKVFHCYATHYDFFDSLAGDQNYVSFTGMITYSKRGKVMDALSRVPMNRVMIETDAPYMLPKGIDANHNAPEYVGYIANAIARHRGLPVEDVITQTTQNAIAFFEL